MNKNMKSILIRLEDEIKLKFKIELAKNDQKATDVLNQAILEYVNKEGDVTWLNPKQKQ